MPIKLPVSRIFRASILLAGFFAADKVLAVIRQVLTARLFGLSADLDAFNAANNLPDLLFALISGGALAIAFIPVLTEQITTHSLPSAWRLFSRIANLAFVTTVFLGILVMIFAEPLVRWRLGIAPGFNAEQQTLVASLMRWNLLATLIFSISGLVMAGLMANQHFLLPAAAPLFYNIGQIIGIVFLAPSEGMTIGGFTLPTLGLGVYGLVYGVIIGAGLHLIVQVPGLIRYKFRWSAEFGLASPEVRKVLSLLGPRLLTMLFIQLIFLARDNLASHLDTGSVSALTYGWMVMQVPETLIGTALGTALLPALAEHAAKQEWNKFWEIINRAIRLLIALTLPITVIFAYTLRPFLALAFGFDEAGNQLLLLVTQMYLLGLLSHSLIEVGTRSFYARQDARIPLLASAVTAVIFIITGIPLTNRLQAPGLALANSIAFTGEVILLFILLRKTMKRNYEMDSTIPRAFLAGAAALLMIIVYSFLPMRPGITGNLIVMLLCFAASIPWIWKEIRLLTRI